MANYKRRRPRSQPRSVMSSPDRVFSYPRADDVAVAESCEPPRKKKKVRRKRFGIEESIGGCKTRKWYETEQQRSAAIAALRSGGKHRRVYEYLPVDRD